MQNRKDIANQIIGLDCLRFTILYHRFNRLQESYYPRCCRRQLEDTRRCLLSTVATKSRDHANLQWANMRDRESTNETVRRNSLSKSSHAVSPKNRAERPCLLNHRQPHGCRVKDGRISLRLRHQPPKPMTIEILLL